MAQSDPVAPDSVGRPTTNGGGEEKKKEEKPEDSEWWPILEERKKKAEIPDVWVTEYEIKDLDGSTLDCVISAQARFFLQKQNMSKKRDSMAHKLSFTADAYQKLSDDEEKAANQNKPSKFERYYYSHGFLGGGLHFNAYCQFFVSVFMHLLAQTFQFVLMTYFAVGLIEPLVYSLRPSKVANMTAQIALAKTVNNHQLVPFATKELCAINLSSLWTHRLMMFVMLAKMLPFIIQPIWYLSKIWSVNWMELCCCRCRHGGMNSKKNDKNDNNDEGCYCGPCGGFFGTEGNHYKALQKPQRIITAIGKKETYLERLGINLSDWKDEKGAIIEKDLKNKIEVASKQKDNKIFVDYSFEGDGKKFPDVTAANKALSKAIKKKWDSYQKKIQMEYGWRDYDKVSTEGKKRFLIQNTQGLMFKYKNLINPNMGPKAEDYPLYVTTNEVPEVNSMGRVYLTWRIFITVFVLLPTIVMNFWITWQGTRMISYTGSMLKLIKQALKVKFVLSIPSALFDGYISSDTQDWVDSMVYYSCGPNHRFFDVKMKEGEVLVTDPTKPKGLQLRYRLMVHWDAWIGCLVKLGGCFALGCLLYDYAHPQVPEFRATCTDFYAHFEGQGLAKPPATITIF